MNALTSTRISQRRLKVIPIEQIRVLNPRARNQRHFKEIVKSIAQVGLKRPITVSARSSDTDPFKYDLVCGQDPNDEDAAQLLHHLRTETSEQSIVRHRRRTRAIG